MLVTGGTGQLGSEIAAAFASGSWRQARTAGDGAHGGADAGQSGATGGADAGQSGAHGRDGEQPRPGGLVGGGCEVAAPGHAELDVGDRDQVMAAVLGFAPDIIVHAAAWTSVDGCEIDRERAFRDNAAGSGYVAEAARLARAHLVYVSTDYVFDGTPPPGGAALPDENGLPGEDGLPDENGLPGEDGLPGDGATAGEGRLRQPYSEWDLPRPLSVYGLSKLAGERECLPLGTVVRTSWVIGPRGPNMLTRLLARVRAGETVSYVDDQVASPSFTFDLAPAVCALAVSRRPGVFHLTNSGHASRYELARAAVLAAGLDPGMVLPTTAASLVPPPPARRPAYSVLGSLAARMAGVPCLPHWRASLDRAVKEMAI
ncbi:MAG: SDR family oxidoreductase [Acidimicrobiales bacterium]